MWNLIKPLNLLAFFVLIAVASACNDDGSGTRSVLTENNFVNDQGLYADPEIHLVVKVLEHPGSEKTENDTDSTGQDAFPLVYSRTIEHTICWEDDDGESGHFMELKDTEGNFILALSANEECVTELIHAGEYIVTVYHDGRNNTTYPVFIAPDPQNNQLTSKMRGSVSPTPGVPEFVKNLLNNIVREATAQTTTPLQTLITTGKCTGCDLKGADLSSANFQNVILTGSDLTGADMSSSNFSGSDFTSANLSGVNMNGTNFTAADFTNANLNIDNLFNTDKLSATNFTFSLWTDGNCKCKQEVFTRPIVDTTRALPSATNPVSLAIAPDSSSVYLANFNSNSMSVIETSTFQVASSVTVGVAPVSIALSSNGSRIYLAQEGMANTAKGSLAVLDSSPGNFGANVDIENLTGLEVIPRFVASSPNSTILYLAHSGNAVAVIDVTPSSVDNVLDNIKLIAGIDVGADPNSLVVSPDGMNVYVANPDNTISIIDTSTYMVTGNISVESEPVYLAISPDGSRIYAAQTNNTVAVIDTVKNQVIAYINVGNDPRSVAVSPDGLTVHVANYKDNDVSVIDVSTNTVIGKTGVSAGPVSVAISPVPSYPLCSPYCVYTANFVNNSVSALVPSRDSCRGCDQ